MPLRLVAGAVALLPLLTAAGEPPLRRDFLDCHARQAAAARLDCYDRAVKQHFLHDFSGQGRQTTPVFQRDRPFRVKYRNDDVIFVIYVYREGGELVNSYGTGPGSGYLEVKATGRFYIEIRATGAWTLWLEPLPAREEARTDG